jgi:hypothetical protein
MQLDSAIATFSVDLIKISHLGKGTLFGSRRVPNTIELSPSVLPLIDENLRARVLAFDWWVANPDRVFVDGAGNPNLLWAIDDKKLIVIDHNLAFEPSLLNGFWSEHAFRHDQKLWTPQFCSRLGAEFRSAISHLGRIWSELPEDWIETPSGISLSQIESLLWRFETNADTFWTAT